MPPALRITQVYTRHHPTIEEMGSSPGSLPCVSVTSVSAGPSPLPKGAVPVPPVVNRHQMTTRGKHGFCLLAVYHTESLSPIPKTYRSALANPNWQATMKEECAALQANQTWDLVPRPPTANMVTGKWIFRHKFHADGSLDRYKARWVLRGFTQRPDLDYDETFSPVVKPAIVRTVLTLVLSNSGLFINRMSKTLFTGPFQREYTVVSLLVLVTPVFLQQSFASYLLKLGFTEAKSDTSLFIYHRGSETIYLLLYVDDIVLTASSNSPPPHHLRLAARIFHERPRCSTPFLGYICSAAIQWTILISATVHI